MNPQHDPVLSPGEAIKLVAAGQLAPIDCSWHLPLLGRDARQDFHSRHLPGAVFLDLDAVAADSPLPHMLPSPQVFSQSMGALGVTETSPLLLYDDSAAHSAARAWWMMHGFGHPASLLYILDGGLSAWQRAGGSLTAGSAAMEPAPYAVPRQQPSIVDYAGMRSVVRGSSKPVVDARPAPRFYGDAAEPRPGLPSGHMPGAINLPYDRLYTEDGFHKPVAALKSLFDAAGLDPSRPMVTSCGSGMTAACIALAAWRVSAVMPALYDGSWMDWANRPDSPIANRRE